MTFKVEKILTLAPGKNTKQRVPKKSQVHPHKAQNLSSDFQVNQKRKGTGMKWKISKIFQAQN